MADPKTAAASKRAAYFDSLPEDRVADQVRALREERDGYVRREAGAQAAGDDSTAATMAARTAAVDDQLALRGA